MMASNDTDSSLILQHQMDEKQTSKRALAPGNKSSPSTSNNSQPYRPRFENIIRLYHDEGAIKNRRPKVSPSPLQPKQAKRDDPHLPTPKPSPLKPSPSPTVEIPAPLELPPP